MATGMRPRLAEGELKLQVSISEEAPVRVHAVRHRGQVARIADAWATLWKIVGEQGRIADITRSVGISMGPPDPRGAIDYYAALIFPEQEPAIAGLEILTLPGGRYAIYRHVGPYSDLPEAYRRLFAEWLPKSGETFDPRPIYERYRNNPVQTPESELITDIFIPVKDSA